MRIVNKGKVDTRTEELREDQRLKSDDPHVIALAQVSGARLLYTNDEDLQKDFRNTNLVNNPSGKVYSTEAENTRTRNSELRTRNCLAGTICAGSSSCGKLGKQRQREEMKNVS